MGIYKQDKYQAPFQVSHDVESLKVQLEKVGAEVAALKEFKKAVQENFLKLAEEIGILRGNIVDFEKDLRENTLKVTKAIELVEMVQPQVLHKEVEGSKAQIKSCSERIESQKLVMQNVMSELKEMRSKVSLFRGTDRLLELVKEVDQKLIDIGRIEVNAEKHADKVEDIYVKSRKRFDKIDNVDVVMGNMKKLSEHLHSEIDNVRGEVENFVTRDEVVTREEVDRVEKELSESNELILNEINSIKEELAKIYSGEQKEKVNVSSRKSPSKENVSEVSVDKPKTASQKNKPSTENVSKKRSAQEIVWAEDDEEDGTDYVFEDEKPKSLADSIKIMKAKGYSKRKVLNELLEKGWPKQTVLLNLRYYT